MRRPEFQHVRVAKAGKEEADAALGAAQMWLTTAQQSLAELVGGA